ncbi:MAG: hypothetical protein ABFD89_06600 [Bryobacteraceae bacterium]
MAFIGPSSKLERAVKALLVLQGKADEGNTFISNDGRQRGFPNRTILATGFSPTVPHRPDGRVYFGVQHHFRSPGSDDGTARAAMDAFVGASADTLMVSDGNSLQAVADAITSAGRWLAQTDGTPEGDAIAKQNADMAGFRCDWIKLGDPFLTRGKTDDGGVEGAAHWVEILNFTAFVSQAEN